MFWIKKRSNNVETKSVNEEINAIKSRLTAIEAQVLDVLVAQNILRNKVLRKIQTKLMEEPETEAKTEEETWAGIPKTKDINNPFIR